jgi:maltose-binding protein MalE
VGCAEGAVTPTQLPSEPTAVPPTRITLTLWHGESGAINETLQRLLLDYQRNPLHNTIEIHVESHGTNLLRDYKEAVLAGGSPDLVLLAENRWIGPLAEQKLVLDITSRITSTEQASFQPAALDGARFNQTLYGLPLMLDLPVLYYNRANISEALPDSTNEWLAAARSFTTDTNQGLAYNLSLYFTQPYISAFNGQLFDQTDQVLLGTTSFTPTLEWLSWVRDLSTDELLLARDDNRLINRAIQQNTALMTIDWARNLTSYRQVWGDNVGIRPLPRLSQTGNHPQP